MNGGDGASRPVGAPDSNFASGLTSDLAALEARLRRDLEATTYPARSWVPERHTARGEPILDVLVVGGGQSGLAIAFGLKRERVDNVLVVDENAETREGPWLTFARMPTLRTPKHVQGPDFGLPSLSVRAYIEATEGPDAWSRMSLIPTTTWARYLAWYRRVLALPVQNETTAGPIRYDAAERCLAVPLRGPGGERVVHARKVVLATGIDGAGAWHVPDAITRALPKSSYAHTREAIDFTALRGKRIAVLGAGASAFDNAACALGAGAAQVDLFFRRPEIVRVNPYRWAEFVGFLKHHGDLPDALRWRFARRLLLMGQLPPADTYARATALAHFRLRPGEPWSKVEARGGVVHITTPKGEHEADFVIVGAGFVTDLARRPELTEVLEHVALWRDRYAPPPGEEHEELARHPYLGPSFELTEKVPGRAPWLSSVFHFTFACLPSLGFGGASISGMKYGLPRVVAGVTRQLYTEDAAHHYASLEGYDIAELP